MTRLRVSVRGPAARWTALPRYPGASNLRWLGEAEYVFLSPAHDLAGGYTMPEAEVETFERVIGPRLARTDRHARPGS